MGVGVCPQVCDFGHSALVHDAADGFRGTAGYAAPEVSCESPEWTPAADVWGVGVVAFAIVANALPTWTEGRDGPDFSSRALSQISLKTTLVIKAMLTSALSARATLGHVISIVGERSSADATAAEASGFAGVLVSVTDLWACASAA